MKHTGELIAFLDLGDQGVNFAEFEKPDSLATHALVLFVPGLASDLVWHILLLVELQPPSLCHCSGKLSVS